VAHERTRGNNKAPDETTPHWQRGGGGPVVSRTCRRPSGSRDDARDHAHRDGCTIADQFLDEVLNGRSVEQLDAIAHPQIEYPTGRMVGFAGFQEIWITDATQRNGLNILDEYQAQVVLGDEQWGMAYLVYTVRTRDNVLVGTWHLAYVAQVADGLIRTLDVVIEEQELE